MDLIFNELSLSSPAPDRETAHRWLKTLSQTIVAAVDRGVARILRTHRAFWEMDVAPGYTFSHWSTDGSVDRDLKRYIMSIAGKSPFIETLHSEEEDKGGELVEFRCRGMPALGLGLAALRNHPAVSMPVEGWQEQWVVVQAQKETAEGSKEEEKSIRHWYDSASVTQRESCEWLRERHAKEIASGSDLLFKRPALLSRLDFTDNALKQLQNFTGAETPFAHVVQHLVALNFRALDWAAGPFETDYPYRCSEETRATLQQYSGCRTFICKDGQPRLFSWHSKIGVEAWRIHFLPLPTSRRVLIGYVGEHLPTVGDPH